jgi:hypothetical protein
MSGFPSMLGLYLILTACHRSTYMTRILTSKGKSKWTEKANRIFPSSLGAFVKKTAIKESGRGGDLKDLPKFSNAIGQTICQPSINDQRCYYFQALHAVIDIRF